MQIVRLTQTTPKRRKLLLVDPYPRENPYHLGPSERKAIWFPKLSLPAIAAYTPEHWDLGNDLLRPAGVPARGRVPQARRAGRPGRGPSHLLS